MSTDTPLTDAIVVLPSGYDNNVIYHQDLVKLCRDLEHKLTTVTAERDSLVQIQLRCIDALDGADEIDWRNESNELLRKVGEHLESMRDKAKLRRERDDLRERLNELLTPPPPLP